MSRASEWKAKARAAALAEAVELTLPSGAVVMARRPDPAQLAVWGRLPLHLAGAAAGERAAGPGDIEDAQQTATFIGDLLMYVLVDPELSLTPAEDQIHPKDICREDWTHLVNWALRVEEARSLEGFRRQRGDAGGSGDGQNLLNQTF